MTTKHTPGPWEIIEKTDPVTISRWSIKIGNQSISFFPYQYHYADEKKSCGGYVSNPEIHANARLICAAPELLEALVKLSNAYAFSKPPGYPKADVEKMAEAAILKATGEQA